MVSLSPYSLLEYKVRNLWKLAGNMNLSDLGHNFFLARFHLEEEFKSKLWQLDFNPAKEKSSNTTTIWARLLGLLLDHYD